MGKKFGASGMATSHNLDLCYTHSETAVCLLAACPCTQEIWETNSTEKLKAGVVLPWSYDGSCGMRGTPGYELCSAADF
uniref:Cl525_1a n=1 Tax=Arundo donax TaxID=35708 RepID=A0A0A9DK30_ARUDO